MQAVCGRGRRVAVMVLLVVVLAGCLPRNPIRPHGADPSIVFWNGNYYMPFTYLGQLTMTKAPTLNALKTSPEQIVWSDADPSRCCNMWAPNLEFLDGRWYLYYTAGPATGPAGPYNGQRMHVLESTGLDPMGPYQYKARLFAPAHDHFAIDPSVLRRSNGELYLFWSGLQSASTNPWRQKLWVARMANPWTLASARVEISAPEQPWEGIVNEGPDAIERNGRVHVLHSANSSQSDDYKIGLVINKDGNLLDPGGWNKVDAPLMTTASGSYGPGGPSFFKSPDGTEDWVAYHANEGPNQGYSGARSLRVQKVSWHPTNGRPVLGQPVPPGQPFNPPLGEPR